MVIPFGIYNRHKVLLWYCFVNPQNIPGGELYFYLHFAYGKTEAQLVSAICHGLSVGWEHSLGWDSGSPAWRPFSSLLSQQFSL